MEVCGGGEGKSGIAGSRAEGDSIIFSVGDKKSDLISAWWKEGWRKNILHKQKPTHVLFDRIQGLLQLWISKTNELN